MLNKSRQVPSGTGKKLPSVGTSDLVPKSRQESFDWRDFGKVSPKNSRQDSKKLFPVETGTDIKNLKSARG